MEAILKKIFIVRLPSQKVQTLVSATSQYEA